MSGQKTIFESIVSSFLDKNLCQICTRGEATIQIITKLCSLIFPAPQNEWKLLANIINWVIDFSLFGRVSEFSSNSHVFLVKSVNFLWQMLSNPRFVADLEGCIPLKDVAETHEITGLMAFLCMPTSLTTGQTVCIDGGLTAHGFTPNSFLGAWKSLVLILMLPQEG